MLRFSPASARSFSPPTNSSCFLSPSRATRTDTQGLEGRGVQPVNHHDWFKCPRCTHTFLSKHRMMRHYRSHCNLNETHFRCTYCDYRSKYSSNVYKHVRRIHKELPLFKPHRLLMR